MHGLNQSKTNIITSLKMPIVTLSVILITAVTLAVDTEPEDLDKSNTPAQLLRASRVIAGGDTNHHMYFKGSEDTMGSIISQFMNIPRPIWEDVSLIVWGSNYDSKVHEVVTGLHYNSETDKTDSSNKEVHIIAGSKKKDKRQIYVWEIIEKYFNLGKR
eukprot:407580_1